MLLGAGFGVMNTRRLQGGTFAKLLRLIYGNASSKIGHCSLFIAFLAGSWSFISRDWIIMSIAPELHDTGDNYSSGRAVVEIRNGNNCSIQWGHTRPDLGNMLLERALDGRSQLGWRTARYGWT